MESLTLTDIFSTDPDTLYNAWLDSDTHSGMTGSRAWIEPEINGRFTCWDEYIFGITLEMVPGKKIVQRWRTTEFPDDAGNSKIELTFDAVSEGTRLTLHHTNIPFGQAVFYKKGWLEFYFEPMKRYFS